MRCIVHVYIYHGKRTQTRIGMGMTDRHQIGGVGHWAQGQGSGLVRV